MMRKRLVLVVIALGLVVGGTHGAAPRVIVQFLVLPVALLLYPLALMFVLLVIASPLLCGFVLWLLWRRVHDGKFPSWVGSAVCRLRTFVFGRRRSVTRQANS
jgi:hypothetical protein